MQEIQVTIDPHKELPPLTVKNLLQLTINVSSWHQLGLELNLTMSQLRDTEITHHIEGLTRMKAEMFNKWLTSSPSASWADLITALRAIGEATVASEIEASCSIKSPDTTGIMCGFLIHNII